MRPERVDDWEKAESDALHLAVVCGVLVAALIFGGPLVGWIAAL